MSDRLKKYEYLSKFDKQSLTVKLYALQITYKLIRKSYNRVRVAEYKMFYVRSLDELEKSLKRRILTGDRLGGVRVDGVYALHNNHTKSTRITKARQVNLEYYTPLLFSFRDTIDEYDITDDTPDNTQEILQGLIDFVKGIEPKINK